MRLSELAVGKKGIIKENYLDPEMTRRLWDLGFTKGTLIEAVQQSPSGDPVAYKVRGTIFAVRQKDAALVEIIKQEVGEDGTDTDT